MSPFTFLLSLAAVLHFSCGFTEPSDPPREAALSYLRAKDLYIAGQWEEALTLLQDKKSRAGDFSAPRFLEGKILFLQKDHSGAEKIWNKVLEKNPHHDETRKWLCRLLLLQGRDREAERVIVPALADDPEDPELLILVGKARSLRGDTAGALEYYRKAKACFERLAEAPLELADLYRSFGLRRRSIEELELAAAMLGRESGLFAAVSGAVEFLKKEEP